MRIVLSGPPSVGKTTQGKRLAAMLGVPHVSSGALIRHGAAHGDPRAQRLDGMVADGSLAPSRDIIDMVLERIDLHDCRNGFVIDGFPRKPVEAEALVAVHAIDAFVVLQASDAVLMSRVLERGRQSSFQRVDDDPAAFPRRMAAYREQTALVADVMIAADVAVQRIDAEGEPEDVWSLIRSVVHPPISTRPGLQAAMAF